jgi:hypothetical protein
LGLALVTLLRKLNVVAAVIEPLVTVKKIDLGDSLSLRQNESPKSMAQKQAPF